ncbi:MAG: penicillin acylase family protein, partial [Waddliaceae bacterium]|nr:penicillin acylase family protein [Waddliaceae bacterium]
MKKLKKYIIITVSALIIISGALAGTIYHFVKGGIAQYSGTVELPGLSAPVTIERDSYGIPTIKASNRADITRAIGFTHGQERFFQMDLLRRKSAGELSELVGKKALPLDKKQRFHQFRKRMQKNFEMMPEAERKDLIAYAEGVNAGVKALSKKPWEYYLLGGTPREWMPEDSMLVGIVMFQELQDSTGEFDLSRGYMEKLLPPDVYEFFVNNGSAWQATLDESITPMKPIPGEESFSYLYKRGLTEEEQFPEIMPIGSNNWVMDGSHTGGQGAIVACDMHLSHSVPNVWYRAHFEYYNDKGEEIVVDGVTLPGAPPIVLGSNGNVAWGLTASEINATDIVIIEETEPGYYKTPDGVMAYEKDTEIINIKGGKTAECDVINTIWGPVLDKTFFGKPVALKWVAHELLSVNMKLVLFEDCVTAEEALEKSKNVRTPALNLVVGDSEGNIGWTLIGYVPKRKGYEGNIPVSFADGTASWEGCLDAEEYPIIYNPSSGILWTANNRTLGNEWTGLLGDGGYFSSARA